MEFNNSGLRAGIYHRRHYTNRCRDYWTPFGVLLCRIILTPHCDTELFMLIRIHGSAMYLINILDRNECNKIVINE